MEDVAGLDHLRDDAGWFAGAGGLEQHFVEVRVEGLIHRVDFADAVLLESFQHLALGRLYAFDKIFKARLGGQRFGRHGLQRPA